jgi:hypothetical protein
MSSGDPGFHFYFSQGRKVFATAQRKSLRLVIYILASLREIFSINKYLPSKICMQLFFVINFPVKFFSTSYGLFRLVTTNT